MRRHTALVWLLRLLGGVTLLAFGAVFLPPAWMARLNDLSGLPPLPQAPIVDYLARSLSLFYALIGGLLIVLSTDVERYRALIRYAGWASIVAGVVVLGIDLHAGMPFWWTIHEGPMAAAIGVVLLRLARPHRPERFP